MGSCEMFQEAVKENERLRKELVTHPEQDEIWESWPFKDDDDVSRWDTQGKDVEFGGVQDDAVA
jgi:hypothetical protein